MRIKNTIYNAIRALALLVLFTEFLKITIFYSKIFLGV